MTELRFAIRYVHIISAAIVLFAFWLPILSKKGSRFHIWTGRFAVGIGAITAVSALVSCIWGLCDVDYAVGYREMTDERRAQLTVEVHYLYSLLAVLSLLVLSSLRLGVRIIRTRETPERLKNLESRAAFGIIAFAGAALLAFAGYEMLESGLFSRYLFLAFIGTAAIFSALGDWKYVCNPRPTPMAWWYKHMECMMGCFIAYYTAFGILGLRSVVGPMPDGFGWIPWVLPSAIGVPLTGVWTKYYRRKFGELSETNS